MTKEPGKVALKRIRLHFPNVKSVRDATRSIIIEVTQKDSRALEKSPSDCALARAARNQVHADGAIVLASSTYLIKKNKAIRFKNSDTITKEITSFDRGSGFMPGKYMLSRVSPGNRLGFTGNKDKNRKSGPHLKVRKRYQVHRTTNIRTVKNI